MFEIYIVQNQINGKLYVGQTRRGYLRRKKEHLRDADKGTVKCLLYYSMRKYGSYNFSFEKIDESETQEGANKRESYWIEAFKTTNPNIGYNMTVGGVSVVLASEESKKRKSEAHRKFLSVPENHPQFRADVSSEEIVALFESGLSRIKIADRLGVSKALVYQRLKKSGVDTSGHTTEHDDEMVKMYAEGHSMGSIAETLSISIGAVLNGLVRKKVTRRSRGIRFLWKIKNLSEKRCSGCEVTKSLEEFGRNKGKRDGRARLCKPCKKEYERKYREKSIPSSVPAVQLSCLENV